VTGKLRRLELDTILKAAAQLPAEDLSMLGLARHMRVRLSTLYHHVRSREHPLELLGRDVLAMLELPSETLHWTDWVQQYARAAGARMWRDNEGVPLDSGGANRGHPGDRAGLGTAQPR